MSVTYVLDRWERRAPQRVVDISTHHILRILVFYSVPHLRQSPFPIAKYDQITMAAQDQNVPDGVATDNDYTSRTGQKDHIPVQKDEDSVEDPIDADTADSDQQLGTFFH